MAGGATRSSKRSRKVSDRMAIVDDADRQFATQARLDALEDGGADDVLAGDDVDEEFNMDDEMDDVEVTARGKVKRRKSTTKKNKNRRFEAPAAAANFAILLEESGLYDDNAAEPNYLTAAVGPSNCSVPRKFCSVCGNFSKYTCVRCGSLYCCKRCFTTHSETRCLKFAL